MGRPSLGGGAGGAGHDDLVPGVAAPKSRPAGFPVGRVLFPGIYRIGAHSSGPGRLLCLDCRERRCWPLAAWRGYVVLLWPKAFSIAR